MALKKTFVQISLFFVFFVFLFSCSDTSTPTAPSVDHIAPAVEWVHPQAGGELSGVVELRFTVTDAGSGDIPVAGSNIDSARVYLDGYSPDGWWISNPTSENQIIYWNTTASDDGVHILEARAWDKAGNLGTSPSLRVIVHNGVPPSEDRTPPDLWWLSPEGGATLKDTAQLQLAWFDESGVDSVALYLNGGQRAVIPAPAGIQTSQVEYFWDTINDSDGVHLWEARAWDAYGNTGVSAGLLVRVQNHETPSEDHTPPVITWLSPEPGDTLQGTVDLHFQLMDDVCLDSAKVYLNGRILQNFIYSEKFYYENVIWITSAYDDGNYIVQVKAWDGSLNVSLSEVVWFRVWNNRPRVIWVLDDYPTIQRAINAAREGDTVRVRAGTYRESVHIMKRVWLESEEGSEHTIIDAAGFGFGISVVNIQDTIGSAIRGFNIKNSDEDGIFLTDGASLRIMNNIIENPGRRTLLIYEGLIYASVINNVFTDSGLELYISFANISNNIIYNVRNTALWNVFLYENPVVPDYNIVFGYRSLTNNPPIHLGENNIIDQDPLFLDNSYRLSRLSPGVNSGNPDLLDPDRSRSDIGAYGGPYAY